MTKSSAFAKSAVALIAGAVALGGGASASAQPYDGGYYGSGGYDSCRGETGNRGIVGALIGGAGGATVGSQFAASGHRRDGSLLGGILGAVAGAAVGKNTSGCNNGSSYYSQPRGSGYGAGYGSYSQGGYGDQPYGYSSGYASRGYPSRGYDDRGYGDRAGRYASRYDDDWAYGGRGERYRVVQGRSSADGCTLAESPVYLPDGRVQKRFVRVCTDSNGRYQVVD